jgi:hypothetical protein
MLKLIKYLSIVAVLVAGLSSAWFWFVSEGLRQQQEDIYGALNKMGSGDFKNDILIIGSSRAQHQLNPLVIDSITKLTSYNIAADGVSIVECEMFLRYYLEENAAPKLVLLNVDLPMFDLGEPIYRVNQYFPYLAQQAIYKSLVKYDNKVKVAKHAPFIGAAFYSDRSVNYALQGWLNPNRSKYAYKKGFIPYEEKWSDAQARKMEKHPVVIKNTKGLVHLEQMYKLCKSKEINLVLMYSPECIEGKTYVANTHGIKEKVKEIRAKYGGGIFDLSACEISEDHSYFKDPLHLNAKGAQWLSVQMGKFLSRELNIMVGDYLFIDKTDYGSKIPDTPLSFPFRHLTDTTK